MATRIRDLPWAELRRLIRQIAPEISILAKRGDKFAQKVMERYFAAWRDPKSLNANHELRVAFEDYVTRDLHNAERQHLMSQFGHLLIEPEKGPTVVVPDGVKH